MGDNDFDVFLPSPLDNAVRSAIFDIKGMKKGNIQDTFEEMAYQWLLSNRAKLSPRTIEALEAYEGEYHHQLTPPPESN